MHKEENQKKAEERIVRKGLPLTSSALHAIILTY